MSNLQNNRLFFSRKKTLVSYLLSVLIVFRHTTAFAIYGDVPLAIDLIHNYLKWAITPAAVPLFFILSGALFYRDYTPDKYAAKLRRRIGSLVIPYLCWNSINMLIEMAETLLLGRFFVGREKMVITPLNLLMGVLHYEYNGPFWFIFCLICFALFAPLIDRILRNPYIGAAAIAAAAVLANFGIGISGWLFFSQTSIVYYLIGGMIGRFGWQWFCKPSRKWERNTAAGFLVISSLLCLYRVMHNQHFPILISEILLTVNALCMWICADFFVEKRASDYPDFMTHSFFLYAMHMNLCAGFARVIYYLLPKHWSMAPVNFLLTIDIFFCLVEGTCFLLKKFCPPLYRALSGDRAK